MNLAEIRKKAEAGRSSVNLSSAMADEASTEVHESDVTGEIALEDFPLPQFEIPAVDIAEDGFASVASQLENEVSASEAIYPFVISDKGEPSTVPVCDADIVDKSGQSKSLKDVTSSKAVRGYDPLKTILSGRESVSDRDDDALFQSTSYTSNDIEEYLCFRVADEIYAISIMSIKEIIKPREATEVPRMPSFIIGVLSLRGVIIPVMDMRLRLSLTQNSVTGRERIVVLRRESGFCGVIVDEVIQVARINRADIEEPPAVLDGIDRDFVTGLGHFDHRMLILLNLEAILDIGVQ